MTGPLPEQGQYAQLFEALSTQYPDIQSEDGSTVFQFSASPLEATWHDGTDYAAYCAANTVSQKLGGYYVPGAGTLTSAYSTFIHSLKPSSHRANSELTELMVKRQDLDDNRKDKHDRLRDEYREYQKEEKNPQPKSEWEADPMGGLEYMEDVEYLTKQIADVDAQIQRLNEALDSELSLAQAALTDPKYQQDYHVPGSKTVALPRIRVEGNLGDDKDRWNDLKDDQYSFQAELNGESVTASRWHTIYESTVNHDCLSTSAGIKVDTSRIISDSQFKIEVTLKGLQGYKVSFDDWFKPTFVNPKAAKFAEGSTVTPESFFGADGSLHLTPDVIWVAYRPRFAITVTTETYKQEFESETNAKIDWVNVFGFRFDIGGTANLKAQDNGTTTTVVLDKPVSDRPYILGVTSTVHYLGDKAA